MASVSEGRFYVYKIMYDDQVVYVGKGSGNRYKVQSKAFGLPATIESRHTSESAAYQQEIRLIAKLSPFLNVHKGGNGSRCQKRISRKDFWTKNFESIGSQKYAARLALHFAAFSNCDLSKVDKLRQVAYG